MPRVQSNRAPGGSGPGIPPMKALGGQNPYSYPGVSASFRQPWASKVVGPTAQVAPQQPISTVAQPAEQVVPINPYTKPL